MNDQARISLTFLLESLKPFKWWVVGLLFVGSSWAVDLSLRPYLLKLMVDNVSNSASTNTFDDLSWIATVYIGISTLMLVVQRFYNFVWLNFNCGLKQKIGANLVNQLMSHSQLFYQDQFAGNLAAKTKDVMSGTPDLVNIIIDKFFNRNLFYYCLKRYFMH